MNMLCPFCEEETALNKITATEMMEVRGEKIPIERQYYHCQSCGEDFEELDENYDPYDAAYREYRNRKGWAQPEDIKAFRDQIGLTQKQFSDLLGIGIATLNRYENGALQSEANNTLIRLCMEDTRAFIQLVRSNQAALSEPEKEKLIQVIQGADSQSRYLIEDALQQFGSYPPSILSGGLPFNFEKFSQVMRFFCYKTEVYKTKLLKLHFYADFKHYKEHGVSITGAKYAHLPFGPVPHKYQTWLVAVAEWEGNVTSEEKEGHNYSGEAFSTDKKPNYDSFSQEELATLFAIKEKFDSFTSIQMAKFSHQEVGYRQTTNGQLISYKYAEELQV